MIPPLLFLAFVVGLFVQAKPTHAHLCPRDGTRWNHRPIHLTNIGAIRAHTCPACGLVWQWVDGPFAHGREHVARARDEDIARVRRGEAPLYRFDHGPSREASA